MERRRQGRRLQQDFQKRYAQLVARTWLDEEFKQRLIDNPDEVLREQGFDVPAGGAEVSITERSETIRDRPADVLYLHLPGKPASLEEGEMAVEQLTDILTPAIDRCHGTYACFGPCIFREAWVEAGPCVTFC